MNMPKINITIPTFNREPSIIRCLESSLHQTYANTTITIVDDGSTDNTLKKVEPYLEDSRITYIKLKSNVGTAAAKNLSILLSDYDAITFHDSDDYFYREKIARQAEAMFMEKPYHYPHIYYQKKHFLEKNEHFDVVTCAFDFKDKFGNVHLMGQDRIVHVESFFPNLIRDHKTSNIWDWILINNALFNKETFETLGGYTNHIEEDREIRNRFILYGYWFNHIHEPLLKKIEDQPNLINGEDTGRSSVRRQKALKEVYVKSKKMWALDNKPEIRQMATVPINIPNLNILQVINEENLTYNKTIPATPETSACIQSLFALDRE